MRHNDVLRLTTETLKRNRVAYQIEQNKHIKVFFHHEGRDRMIVIGRNPGDWRVIRNKRAELKRLGLE